MQMTDDVLADHKIGDDIIHENLYELKIKSSPTGLPFEGSVLYEENSWVVTDIAQPKWGAYEFVSWTVDDQWVEGNPITVLMDKDRVVTAIYALHPIQKQDSVNFVQDESEETFDLSIISPYGKTLGTGSYSAGEVVDFSVSQQFVVDPVNEGVRYAFSGWSDGNTPNLMTNFIKMDESKTITANWSKQYSLKILDSTQNMDVIGVSWHNENSTAPLTVNNFDVKSDGYVKRTLNEWISTGSNFADIKDPKSSATGVFMDNPFEISIDWKNQFYLDATSKYGTVIGNGFYDEGSIVTASINSEIQNSGIAGTRLVFDGWNGDAISDGQNVQVIMDEPKSIEGVWKKQFELM